MKSKFLILFLLVVTAFGQSARGSTVEQEDFYADNGVLAGIVVKSLERSPELHAAWARYRSALQKAPQVSALPDPMFTFSQFIRRVETRVGPQINTFNISQKIPWFGKLDLAGQSAIREAAARYHQFSAMERELIARVKLAYYELQYVDWALRLTEEEEEILDYYERLAQSRYASGSGLQQGVIKIQTELVRILDRKQMLGRQRDSLMARLNTMMDEPPESVVVVPEASSPPEVELNLEELYKLGEENRQELLATLSQIESAERTVQLRKKDYWPDLTLSAGMIHVGERGDPAGILMPPPDNGKNAYNFSVGINIPIWRDKYQAGVVEATENVIAAKKSYLAIRNEVELAIREQVIRLETLRDQMGLYRDLLLPQAEESLRSSEAAYQTGQVGALELLDSERLLISSRLSEARYQIDYLKSLAELERAVGTRFPR